jgi:hypothetical protein
LTTTRLYAKAPAEARNGRSGAREIFIDATFGHSIIGG